MNITSRKTQEKIKVSHLSFYYGKNKILDDISTTFFENKITAIVGPSGHGKSTLLSCFNRLWEENHEASLEGKIDIYFSGFMKDIHHKNVSVIELRRKVGMVFQKPNPLPMSIFNNVALPLKLAGIKDKVSIAAKVKEALRMAFLWNEVKDRLSEDARKLSGGQQQRLCIARSLVLKPEILLLDEPTASLDPRACAEMEELLVYLKEKCTLLMVSHYTNQVQRIADRVIEIENGKVK